ncbi:MAG: hypothetical protein JNN13_03510 [Planctomycetes bacterium]|nr:hypothetical protein [Planctomycetota bacterium]
MRTLLHSVLCLCSSLPFVATAVAAPQTPAPPATQAPARKAGAICKEEVDALIAVLRSTARAPGAAVPKPGVLGDSVGSTAQILVAMANSSRRYHVGDGPVVRPSLDYLIASRKADGSFGDRLSTLWAADALVAIAGHAYDEEVAAARAVVGKHDAADFVGFEQRVTQVLDQLRADVFPQHLAAPAMQRAAGYCQQPASLDRAAAADTLLQMVACQVANLRLDQAAASDRLAVTFSPAQEKAFAWLAAQQQDGVFAVRGQPSVEFTGFGLLALQTRPKTQRTAEQQAAITKGLTWLAAQQGEDGTFGDRTPNYSTCVAVAALAHDGDPIYTPHLQKAQRALLGFQNLEAQGYAPADRDYGSIGYGDSQRGDLSNTQFALEALRATGLPANSEALQKALVFLRRTQNLKAFNDFSGKVPDPERDHVLLDGTSGDDGGAAYYPGNSNAGYIVQPDGKVVARSYGSMTYALLKSYTLAGLAADDPRVVAAVKWVQQNWTLAVNPGHDPAMGEKAQYQGLFYYYMVLAQALDLVGVDKVRTTSLDAAGKATELEIDWRQALRAQLERMQAADGSWINDKNARWYEGMPLLCTCYAMVALERCR